MDDLRVQAYVELIEQLLGCAQGEEETLLQANALLVDAGLVGAMGQYADWLEIQGDSNAGWLRDFAGQLAQVLGLAEENPGGSSAGDARGFLIEIVQLIAQTQNPTQVHGFFRANLSRLDRALLAELPDVFEELIQQNDKNQIAAIFVKLGNLIQHFTLGTRWLNLELGIAAYQLALQIRTREAFPEKWAETQNNLAASYCFRIRGERAENIEQAINAYQLALQIHTHKAFPEQWAMTQNNLATAYYARIQGERAENIEQAINAYQLALQVRTREAFPEKWAQTQNNLANAYCFRIRGERAENIEQAINAYQLALQIRTREAFSEQWAETQNNLAIAYSDRIRGERAENIEQAINAYQLALQVYTFEDFPETWATIHNNLAIVYKDRIRGEWVENIEQAINACQLALQVYTQEAFPEDWAMTQNNLATAYYARIRGERAENIERAIAAYQLALQVYTQEAFPAQWAETQNNLAIAYYARIQGERAENIEQAITVYQSALQVHTREAFPEKWAWMQNNLATAYRDRIRGEPSENIEQAIAAYQLALQVLTHEAFPKECRRTSHNLGNLCFQQQNWNAAKTAYGNSLEAAEILYQSCILLDGKAAELAETADLPRQMAYVLAQTGNLTQAVETLEQGRARGLSESLNRDRADLTQLQQIEPNFYNQYQALTQELRNLETTQRDRAVSSERHQLTPETIRERGIALRQQLDRLLQDIHQVPGYENFLTLPKFPEVHQAAKQDCPLIYLVITSAGSLALLVTLDNIDVIWLKNFTDKELDDLLNTLFTAYEQSQSDRQGWHDAIDSTTRQLWDSLMGALVQQIKKLGFKRAILIPTGYLSLLPLHAAWTEDTDQPTGRRYAIDEIHFTYAPNAKSLTAAQVIADRVQVADSILAIDNPRQDLPNSEREINCAISTFSQSSVLRHEKATIAAVKDGLVGSSVVHFSCHGIADLQSPLNSGLLLYDELLTLKDIFALNLADSGGIRLAILSACETGLVGIENTDEAIGLPTGLIQAGVAAVIASLWSVSDLSTMMLLARFYELWRIEGLEIALALRQAQQWVRDTTNGEKLIYFKDFKPIQSTNKMPASAADYLYKSLILSHPDARDFAHPFHWAAFSYVGV
jgi:CHAT domain-containing protein/tetratricopeptide (TPR) repeat protein